MFFHSARTGPFRSHPPGLQSLFIIEMWERFSFYGMRALLIFYLVDKLKYGEAEALRVYGIYTALVYLTPILGGWLADCYLGQRKAVAVGALLMAAGHFAMAFESLLYPAMGLIILGNGFFKPNISTMVGALYPEGDSRKESAFTIFYMGINLGALVSSIACPWLQVKYGFDYGFALAGIGMIFSLAWLIGREQTLEGAGLPPGRIGSTRLAKKDWQETGLISLVGIIFVVIITQIYPLFGGIWTPGSLEGHWLFGWRLFLAMGSLLVGHRVARRFNLTGGEALTRDEWSGVIVCLVATIAMLAFTVGFEQAGGTMNLFAKAQTNLLVGNFNVPPGWFQSLNPVFIILLGPAFSWYWSHSGRKLSSMTKQALGLFLLSASFIIMFFADYFSTTSAGEKLVSPLWLVGAYFFATLAELCISPVGLSQVSKFAPGRILSFMMAVFFLASFIGNYLAGTLKETLSYVGINLWLFLSLAPASAALCWLALKPLLARVTGNRV